MANPFATPQSIPNVFLVPVDLVLAQQCTQFVLKTYLTVMFLLSGDVLLHLLKVGLAHGESRVTALPFKVCEIATALL